MHSGEILELPDRGKLEIGIRRVLANPDQRVTDKMVGWDRKVVGRWNAVKYAPGQVIFRAMAGAEITAGPVGGGRRRIRLRFEEWNAAEMSADADNHAEFRLDRTM